MGEIHRRKAREQARDDVAFSFGFFAGMLPVVALLAGGVGIVTGLTTPSEMLITVTLMAVLVACLDHSWTIGTILYRAIVNGTAEVVVRLRPVPIAGTVAEPIGYAVVLWLPIVTLAAVVLLV